VVFDILDRGFQKAAGERCRHLTPAGCGVYDARPVSCRSFRCLWLNGAGEEQHRPDRAGFLLRDLPHPTNKGEAMVQVLELRAGALAADTEGEAIAHEIGYEHAVLMVRMDGTRRAIQPTTRFMKPVVLDSGKAP
jgi:Fe-S-cluster containining protein